MVTEKTQTAAETAADEADEPVGFSEDDWGRVADDDESSGDVDNEEEEDKEEEEESSGDQADDDSSDADESAADDDDSGEEETAEEKATRLANEKAAKEEQTQATAAADQWWNAVLKHRPDAETVAQDPGFKSWLSRQDAETRQDANGDPASALAVPAKYDASAKDGSTGSGDKIDIPTLPALPQFLKDRPEVASKEITFVGEDGQRVTGTLGEFLTSDQGYPDVFTAMWDVTQAAMQTALTAQSDAIMGLLGKKGYVTQGDIDDIRSKIGEVDVLTAHSDAARIQQTPEYNAWLKKQSPVIQNLKTGNAEERIALLDLYKQQAGIQGEQDTTKADRDKLHTHTLRGGQRAGGPASRKTRRKDGDADDEESFAERWDKVKEE